MQKILLKGALLFTPWLSVPAIIFASVWEITTVDNNGIFQGSNTSLALDVCNNAHISYYSEGGDIKYATNVFGEWMTTTVDSEGDLGWYNSLTLDSSGNPHISYSETVPNYDLKYAYYDGIWHTKTVDSEGNVGNYISLALNENGNPCISYYDDTNGDLKYAWCDMDCGNTGNWNRITVDSEGYVGWYTSLALDSRDNPHISYFDYSNNDLKYAHYDGSWHIETVDSEGDVGKYTSLALDSSGNPHISYYANHDLKYAYYDGSWHIESVDSEGLVGRDTSLALDSSGNPHISYFDQTNYDLKYAHYDGNWHTETVDSEGDVGLRTSLSLDSSGNPHISYFDWTNYNHKYAYERVCQNDFDGDCVLDNVDNCPNDYNPAQEDIDSDLVGDACDECTDTDDDGYGNPGFPGNSCPLDNCPYNANPFQEDLDDDSIGDVCDDMPFSFDLLPAVDGTYYFDDYYDFDFIPPRYYYEEDVVNDYIWAALFLGVGISPLHKRKGLMEFDISNIEGLFTSGQIEARLSLTVISAEIPSEGRLSLGSMQDGNENGVISVGDVSGGEYIGEICEDLQPGDTITFDVTSALEHDLFNPDQTNFSGFVISSNFLEFSANFYSHTDAEHSPRLSIVDTDLDNDEIINIEDNCLIDYNPDQTDTDGDCIGDVCDDLPNDYDPTQPDVDSDEIGDICDNCPNSANPDQEDTYPPQGNGIGDACDCEGDFDGDNDCDGTDAATFKIDFGRSTFENPCETINTCNGDFDCDGDCDGTDAAGFKFDFGRSRFTNPCPACAVGDWCVYP